MLTAAASASPSPMPSPLRNRPATTAASAVDSDGDRDDDARESPAAQAAESRNAAQSLPADPNRGRSLNITV
ncbi:hypothetical protein EI613_22055 [Azospirillum sp. 412522]|nr:hypothetical protein [Azospirillum sp. 412522]MBY6264580.1 hypothetical protein [Azospirillum sp. 412522]